MQEVRIPPRLWEKEQKWLLRDSEHRYSTLRSQRVISIIYTFIGVVFDQPETDIQMSRGILHWKGRECLSFCAHKKGTITPIIAATSRQRQQQQQQQQQ
eukprot:scaffold12118_cov138-Cylindrotheca_fusiformis.AAC.5